MSEPELFLTQAQDQEFKKWMLEHPYGFYLNERTTGTIRRSEGEMILHKVGCHHLGDGEGYINTTYAKAAAENYEELVAWAKKKGLGVHHCQSCKPIM